MKSTQLMTVIVPAPEGLLATCKTLYRYVKLLQSAVMSKDVGGRLLRGTLIKLPFFRHSCTYFAVLIPVDELNSSK